VLADGGLLVLFVLLGPHGYVALADRGGAFAVLYAILGGAVVMGYVALLFGALGLGWTYVIDPGALGALVVLFLVGGWGLGRDVLLEERADRSEAAAERAALLAEKKSLEAQAHALLAERNALLALRAQLDPHFLFNTLNAIAEWCATDPTVAEEALLRLSRLLRSMLDGTQRASWPLATELELVTELAALFSIRDASRYRFRRDADVALPSLEVPPMLLLPLVENAITHGPAAGHEGEVVLTARPAGEGVTLTITNPGAFSGRREGGQGIGMVEKRLRLAYGERAHLSVSAVGERTQAELVLPGGAPAEAA
jgi:LytS/YehU family sensor histidine kinase